jgi:hypothetical protein
MKGVSFELFFTGHSLGGWLAQVTTYTIEYLKRVEKFFLRRNNDNDFYHPHTVVFESPGCKDMLSEMRYTSVFIFIRGQIVQLLCVTVGIAGTEINVSLLFGAIKIYLAYFQQFPLIRKRLFSH